MAEAQLRDIKDVSFHTLDQAYGAMTTALGYIGKVLVSLPEAKLDEYFSVQSRSTRESQPCTGLLNPTRRFPKSVSQSKTLSIRLATSRLFTFFQCGHQDCMQVYNRIYMYLI